MRLVRRVLTSLVTDGDSEPDIKKLAGTNATSPPQPGMRPGLGAGMPGIPPNLGGPPGLGGPTFNEDIKVPDKMVGLSMFVL